MQQRIELGSGKGFICYSCRSWDPPNQYVLNTSLSSLFREEEENIDPTKVAVEKGGQNVILRHYSYLKKLEILWNNSRACTRLSDRSRNLAARIDPLSRCREMGTPLASSGVWIGSCVSAVTRSHRLKSEIYPRSVGQISNVQIVNHAGGKQSSVERGWARLG